MINDLRSFVMLMFVFDTRSPTCGAYVIFVIGKMVSPCLRKIPNYNVSISHVNLQRCRMNACMPQLAQPARLPVKNSTAHWANTLMVDKNKLCERNATTTTTTDGIFLRLWVDFIDVDASAVEIWWQRAWVTAGIATNIFLEHLHVDFSRMMWHRRR